jgi:hypothetical protein
VLGSTPGWLRVVSAVVAALAVAAGVVGLLAALARHNGALNAVDHAAPLVVNAQAVHTSLSDADTTVAGGFLAGPVISPAAESRYQNDLANASAALAAVARHGGGNARVAVSVKALGVDVPIYAGIVQTAVANNRQGFPVGAAYLAEANNLMRATMLPAATALDAAAAAELDHDNNAATSSAPLVITFVLLGLTFVGLLILQVRLARRFRRLLNLPMLAATVAVIAVGVWAVVATSAEHNAITRGRQQGVAPLAALTQARTLAFQLRGDDELTLVTRDAVASYQKDYTTAIAQLRAVLAPGHSGGWTSEERVALTQASTAVERYDAQHVQVRRADVNGDLTQAIALDANGAGPAAAQLDQALSSGINTAVSAFDHAGSSAASDVNGVGWGWLALMVLAALAVLVGVEPRIREYR